MFSCSQGPMIWNAGSNSGFEGYQVFVFIQLIHN